MWLVSISEVQGLTSAIDYLPEGVVPQFAMVRDRDHCGILCCFKVKWTNAGLFISTPLLTRNFVFPILARHINGWQPAISVGSFKSRPYGGYDMGDPFQDHTPDTQFFRDVFNASPIGIAVENFNGQLLFANPALCAMLGFSEEEMVNKHCVDFSPPQDAAKDWELFQQLRAGTIDHYQLEKHYFRRDGSLVWGSLSISLLNGRPFPLVIAMVEDITEKKAAEEARFRHAAIVESSQDAIMAVTLDGIIVSWNTGAQRIYGYTEAEALGKPIHMVVPPELPDEEDRILETLRTGKRIEHFETVRVTKTGKRINVSLSVSPIKGPTGEPVGCAGIARDITERKCHEAALRTSEERLREYE